MTTSISSALTLMLIGMITVFLVLFLVYLTGTILIRIVNIWFPESQPVAPVSPRTQNQGITPQQIAAITTAVEIFTEGRAQIINIEKQ